MGRPTGTTLWRAVALVSVSCALMGCPPGPTVDHDSGSCTPSCDNTHCGAGTSNGCDPAAPCGCATGMTCSTANTCCTPENGAASCNAITTALCARVIMCCNAMPAGACQSWAYTNNNCLGHLVANGFDCASVMYTGMMVCTENTARCVGDIPLVACSDIAGGTVNLPASCH